MIFLTLQKGFKIFVDMLHVAFLFCILLLCFIGCNLAYHVPQLFTDKHGRYIFQLFSESYFYIFFLIKICERGERKYLFYTYFDYGYMLTQIRYKWVVIQWYKIKPNFVNLFYLYQFIYMSISSYLLGSFCSSFDITM